MLMNKLDVLAECVPFYKEWIIGGRVKKYFHEYFSDLHRKTTPGKGHLTFNNVEL